MIPTVCFRKVSKGIRALLPSLMAVLLFLGCTPASSFQFTNSSAQVVSIALLYKENRPETGSLAYDYRPIRELEADEIPSFMEAISQLETEKMSPCSGYGTYVAKVTYSNGEVDMLGDKLIESVAAGEEPAQVGIHYFTDDAFTGVFANYTEIENYPVQEQASRPSPYGFTHPTEKIQQIELLYNPSALTGEAENWVLLRQLETDEIAPFMEEVYELAQVNTVTVLNIPISGYGLYIARVTYDNGDMEIIGDLMMEFVKAGDTPTESGWNYLPRFRQLFAQYENVDGYPGYQDASS